MDRTPGALLRTREMVAGERFRYSPRVRKLMGWPGGGSEPGLARLLMHSLCTTTQRRGLYRLVVLERVRLARWRRLLVGPTPLLGHCADSAVEYNEYTSNHQFK